MCLQGFKHGGFYFLEEDALMIDISLANRWPAA